MSAAEPLPSFTFDEFLKLEQVGEGMHEWVAGQVYLMSGGTERHSLLGQNLFVRVRDSARRSGCRAFNGNRLVRTDQAAYYPDVMVTCSGAPHRLYETDASWVVEVLSPSTRTTDRREKAAAYAALPSLKGYVLIDPIERIVQVGTYAAGTGWDWRFYPPGSTFTIAGVDVDVSDMWAELDAEASLD